MERPRAQQIKDRSAANVASQQFLVVVSRATGVFCGSAGTTICGTGATILNPNWETPNGPDCEEEYAGVETTPCLKEGGS